MSEKRRILLLGGTAEARKIAATNIESGHQVTTSLAGRTEHPVSVPGNVRIGGFGGICGLCRYIKEHAIDLLIDATHPFATQISANAREACLITGIEFENRVRPAWEKSEVVRWTSVTTEQQAIDALPRRARAFLALGSQQVAKLVGRDDCSYLLRMIEPPKTVPNLIDHEIIFASPGDSLQSECELLQSHGITHLICRNSGGERSFLKVEAAARLGLSIIVIERPTPQV
ncbi:MAG: cobalt-precorrin-6A reductase [Pseudomonadota bacterium]